MKRGYSHRYTRSDISVDGILIRTDYALSRLRVVKALGGCCVKCGFTDSRALHIDHINSGGQRARSFGETWLDIHKEILGGHTERFQLLCANCNCIKKYEAKEISMSTQRRLLLTKVTEVSAPVILDSETNSKGA